MLVEKLMYLLTFNENMGYLMTHTNDGWCISETSNGEIVLNIGVLQVLFTFSLCLWMEKEKQMVPFEKGKCCNYRNNFIVPFMYSDGGMGCGCNRKPFPVTSTTLYVDFIHWTQVHCRYSFLQIPWCYAIQARYMLGKKHSFHMKMYLLIL